MGSLKGGSIFLIIMLIPVLALAGSNQETNKHQENDENGFFGSILIGGGVATGKPSGLEVVDDNKKISTLDERSDRQNRDLLLIMGELGYEFASTGTRISLSNQKSEKSFVDLVVAQPLEDIGTVRASFGFGKEDVWADPYVTGVDRREADEESYNLKLEWEEILGSGFFAALKLSSIEVDHDLIGERYQDLKRDGQIVAAEIGYVFPVGENQMIIPGFDIEVEDRDGESNSCKKAGVSLSHIIEFDRWHFLTSLGVGKRDFDKTHPIFHKTRKQTQYELSHIVTYYRPFGWKGCFLNGLLTYSRTDADIDFFKQDELTIGTGIGYEF